MKCVLIREIRLPSGLQILIDGLKDYVDLVIPKSFDQETLLKETVDADIWIGDRVTEAMLSQAKSLKLLQVPFAGLNNLDFELLRKYNVLVANSHSNSLSVAEFAVGLIFSIAKKIPYYDKSLRQNVWGSHPSDYKGEYGNFLSDYVSGKTFAFIGYGSIGRKIGLLLSGFEPKILAIVHDKKKSYEEVSFVGDSEDLDYVLSEADYVVVTAPLTEKTRGMLNREKLSKLKKSSYLINVARGPIIEEEALYEMLSQEKIAGAAIDTWYSYPKDQSERICPSRTYDFSTLNNIIMSPHRAAEIQNDSPHLRDAIENIRLFSQGKPIKNILDQHRGY